MLKLREALHRLFDDGGAGIEPGVAGLTGLEKRVGVLRRAAELRTIRGQRARAVLGDELLIDHEAQVIIAQ